MDRRMEWIYRYHVGSMFLAASSSFLISGFAVNVWPIPSLIIVVVSVVGVVFGIWIRIEAQSSLLILKGLRGRECPWRSWCLGWLHWYRCAADKLAYADMQTPERSQP